MSFGRGFSVSGENDIRKSEIWVPMTPEKRIPTGSNIIPLDQQVNQWGSSNWNELLGIYGGLLKETSCNVALQNVNPGQAMQQDEGFHNKNVVAATDRTANSNAVSLQNIPNEIKHWDGNPLAELSGMRSALFSNKTNRSIPFTDTFALPNSYSQLGRGGIQSYSSHLLFGDQHYIPRPNQRINGGSLLHMAKVTAEHRKQLRSHHVSEQLNFSAKESSTREKDMQEKLRTSLRNEASRDHCAELLQNTVESSSILTPFKEKNDSDNGCDRHIDLNKTPQQKPPKRRKHRPKVVMEGKPKRTQKSEVPDNDPTEKPTGKRKYVRRKGLNASATSKIDVVDEVTGTPAVSVTKSCRRVLNFDIENETRDESHNTPKTNPPSTKPSGKRRYVRKKSLNASTATQADKKNEVTAQAAGSEAKSCRTVLNLNSENKVRGKSHERPANDVAEICKETRTSQLNFDTHATEMCIKLNSVPQTKSPEQSGLRNGQIIHKQLALNTSDFAYSVNNRPSEFTLLPEKHAPLTPVANTGHTLNTIARTLNVRNANACLNGGKGNRSQDHHVHRDVISPPVCQVDTATNLDRKSQFMLNGTVQMVENSIASLGRTEAMRDYFQSIRFSQPCSVSSMNSPKLCQDMLREGEYKKESNHYDRHSEYHKRMKTVNQNYPTISAVRSCIESVRDSSQQLETRAMFCIRPSRYSSQFLDSNSEGRTRSSNCYLQSMTADLNLRKQHAVSVQSKERAAEKISQCSIPVHDLNSLNAITTLNMFPHSPSQQGPPSSHVHGTEVCHANLPFKRQMIVFTSSNQASSNEKGLLQEQNSYLQSHNLSSTKEKGSLGKQKPPVSVDEITFQLKGLNIYKKNAGDDQNALVLYKGDRNIIPYEGFDPIKKRKPRPKVDLDSETNRIWNLLMGKEGIESTEAAEKDKQKWWEEERRMYHGRVDSFIARMHLVQGDRRFTKWKGSVVDSVIGVFLTQNVSDHLSSSAFMSLVAKFPLCSTTTNQTCCENGIITRDEQEEIHIQDPGRTSKHHEVFPGNPVYDRSSSDLILHRTDSIKYFDSLTPIIAEGLQSSSVSNSEANQTGYEPNMYLYSLPNLYPQMETTTKGISGHAPEDLFSDERTIQEKQQPQKPAFNTQNPRWDDDSNLNDPSKFAYSVNSAILHMQGSNVQPINTWLKVTPGLDMGPEERFRLLGEESISFLHSTASEDNGVENINSMRNMVQQITGSQKNGVLGIEASNMPPYTFLDKHSMHQSNFKSGFHTSNNQNVVNNHQGEGSNTLITSDTDHIRATEAWEKRETGSNQLPSDDPEFTGQTSIAEEVTAIVDKLKLLKNKPTEAGGEGQFYSSSEPTREEDTNNSNAKKRKAVVEKQKTFEWDGLRRMVLSSGERRERNEDTMDSLDYEALRNADVNEISNAIKERGMNNMLAERIKDFLNRMVREHGSIDLEWLKNVPSDSAKDYLLSVRGLGLKSVECVRLLTLYHHAFPVDTNVGRIAVRLGWVPLKPLPESLQLHLLELYPVLESIQKYLWPRLCKLDQRTLYELHYQMITFGKVFCTKSKPNCNACPMRGECRHFASAFASARLSLPGSEEKRILGSATPIVNDKIPAAAIKTMTLPDAADQNHAMLINTISLPLSGSSIHKVECYTNGKCEPIIEEPTTPEPLTEVLESNIEDAFDEDPDEIPTIKLNMEEFTLNLQNYMQNNNIDLHESDVSKALVVLDPQAASIPVPKLKNVSRLRTEHQVYELPDLHPLLKELHIRERDDPSPYLLAVWTPGETANSIQPPESRCESRASGKMCNEKTCFSCNSIREENLHTVRGTLLIPCRTAMRGRFPLNGTYFQVNEVFADHESSLNPIDVPRAWLWNLPRRTVYFGTSVSTIFKGLPTEGIQYCFWRGFVCVRGFDRRTSAPRPMVARFHFPASRLVKMKNDDKKGGDKSTTQR